jgi:hypothetical protein
MAHELVPAAVRQLQSTANRSLAELAAERQREQRNSIILIDTSLSMNGPTTKGSTRIVELGKVLATLRKRHPDVPVVAFCGAPNFGTGDYPARVLDNELPTPASSTPLGRAIGFCASLGAHHIVLISDGEPNSRDEAFDTAAKWGGQIDTFFVGRKTDDGADFLKELARRTGGKSNVSDLGTGQKALAGKVTLALTAGTPELPAPSSAIAL